MSSVIVMCDKYVEIRKGQMLFHGTVYDTRQLNVILITQVVMDHFECHSFEFE